MSLLCRSAALFFYWDTQRQHLWRREFLANEKFRPWKCVGFDSVLFVIVFLFRPPLGTKRPQRRGQTEICFMILYYFMLPLSPLPLSTRKTTRANKNSTFTQSAIIYSESTRSDKQLHIRRDRLKSSRRAGKRRLNSRIHQYKTVS